jgi:hypothetical protein
MNERERGDEPVVANLLMSAKWHLPRRESPEYDASLS